VKLSLRGKFYLLVAALVVGVAGILSTYFVRQLRLTVHQDLELRARALTENLARNAEVGVLLRSTELLEGPLRSLLADPMVLLAVATDADGNPLAQLGRPGESPIANLRPWRTNEVKISSDLGRGVFEVSAPVLTGEVAEAGEDFHLSTDDRGQRRRVGAVYLRSSYAQAESAARRLSVAAMVITAALVGGCLLIGIVLVRQIVNPLLALEAGTLHIAQGNLSYRVPFEGKDELGRLASSFNSMADEVQRSRHELAEHNRNLEQKVAEKTQILSLANRRLEEMNRLKSEFLANMSHELRTPLNAIIGFTDLILDDQAGSINEQQKTYLTTVHTSGQHLLSLINSILDLSKIEAGKMELFPEEFYVQDVVQFALSLVGPLASRKKVRLEKTIDDGVKTLIADQTKIQQILQNLLSNAVKFTPEGGEVHLRVSQDDSHVLFGVTDTGVGIAPQDQQRIFKAFIQVDASYTRRFEGTGLGLALVDHFVRMHRGRVWVESEVGKGSTFYVRLPRVRGTSHELGAEPADLVASGDTVLVVEDDPVARKILEQYLGETGCEVRFAGTSEEAMAMVRERRPALITLDVLLAGESGWNLLAELKADPVTSDIPVMVISSVDERGIGCAFGVEDYLVKPVRRQQLMQRLTAMGLSSLAQRRKVEVLVIDDHPDARLLLRGMLEGENVHVIEASDGKEGLETARVTVPDLILLDLMMPEVSGFEVLRQLRANPTTSKVPVIIVTAKEITHEDLQRLNGDAQALLQKAALSGNQFLHEVRRVLGAKVQHQEAVHA
jgi:signal transduction histidine kinase/DNA-binding response OmpR family regulator